jgi:hypothetical protein
MTPARMPVTMSMARRSPGVSGSVGGVFPVLTVGGSFVRRTRSIHNKRISWTTAGCCSCHDDRRVVLKRPQRPAATSHQEVSADRKAQQREGGDDPGVATGRVPAESRGRRGAGAMSTHHVAISVRALPDRRRLESRDRHAASARARANALTTPECRPLSGRRAAFGCGVEITELRGEVDQFSCVAIGEGQQKHLPVGRKLRAGAPG